MYAEYYRSPERFLNVFFLDDDPVVSAQALCDSHVSKSIVEAAQVLSTVWHTQVSANMDAQWVRAVELDWHIPTPGSPYRELKWLQARLCGQRIYRPNHERHPCVAWASLYGGNYAWLYALGCALLVEFTYRTERIHACTPVLRALELMPPTLLPTVDKYCDAPAVMSSDFIISEDAATNYKNYYRKSKVMSLQYTRRAPPKWIADVAIYKEQ
jgi:hypothetical protein